jgi:hypothetical protein
MKLVMVTQWVSLVREASPTYPKPSQQGSSDLRVQAPRGEYEAGASKMPGRVIEPRNEYSGGQQDKL